MKLSDKAHSGLTSVVKGLGVRQGAGRSDLGMHEAEGAELECLAPGTKHLNCSDSERGKRRGGTVQSPEKKKKR